MAKQAGTRKKTQLAHTPEQILEMYERIAFCDISEFTDFGTVEDDAGNLRAFMKLKDAADIDGRIIEEIVISSAGVPRVKLYDKFKALEKLERYYDMLPDQWKRKLEEKKLKLAEKVKEGAVLNVLSNVPRPGNGEDDAG